MKTALGILVAPRPSPTYPLITARMKDLDPDPILFAEPGCCIDRTEYLVVQRPDYEAPGTAFESSPEGVYGNFQNWIQAGRDLLEIAWDSEAFILAEDDALVSPGIRKLLERDLWPSPDCGCVSLYCPNMSQYDRRQGLFRASIVRPQGILVGARNNLVGSLALVFPKKVLRDLVYNHRSIQEWKGSHAQAHNAKTPPWERKAVDTWIGRTLIEMGKEIWHYSPSLVLHYSPLPDGTSNSSMGHDAPRGKHSTRQCREWAGENPGDLCSIYPQPRDRYDIATCICAD